MRWQGEAAGKSEQSEVSVVFNLYCIYDTVAQQSSNPFVAPNDAAALRELDRVSRREGSDASEYEIWFLGIWKPLDRVIVASEQSQKVSRPVRESGLKAV